MIVCTASSGEQASHKTSVAASNGIGKLPGEVEASIRVIEFTGILAANSIILLRVFSVGEL